MKRSAASLALPHGNPVSKGLLALLVGTLLFVKPADAGSSTNTNACYAESNGLYFTASITTSGTATPNANDPGTIVLWNTSVEAVFSGATMVGGYNLGLLAAGDNNIPVDVVSTINATNSVEGTSVDVQSGVVLVTISDPDGTPNTDDETASPLVVTVSVPDSIWTPTGGDMLFTQGTYTLTAHLAGGAVSTDLGPCESGTPLPDGTGFTSAPPSFFAFLPERCASDADCGSTAQTECINPSKCEDTECQPPLIWSPRANCSSNGGSFCDGEGNCVECVADLDCPYSEPECQAWPTCESNVCVAGAYQPEGTSCALGACNAAGACQLYVSISVSPGTIDSIAGGGSDPDGTLATGAAISPRGMAAFENGMLVADYARNSVRFIDFETGIISRVVGAGGTAPPLDSQEIDTVNLLNPVDVAVVTVDHDSFGVMGVGDDILILESAPNNRLIRIERAPYVSDPEVLREVFREVTGDSGPDAVNISATTPVDAAYVQFEDPVAVDVDADGNIYVLDRAPSENSGAVVKIDSDGLAVRVAGRGSAHRELDDIPAIDAMIPSPSGFAVTPEGDLYIADTGHGTLRFVDVATGIITTVAGGGSNAGDGPALSLALDHPYGVEVDSNGRVLFTTSDPFFSTALHQLRRYDPVLRTVTTIAGAGPYGFSGDGGDPLLATFWEPQYVLQDTNGIVYVSDTRNERIRAVSECATDANCDSSSLFCYGPSVCSNNVCEPRPLDGTGCPDWDPPATSKDMRVACDVAVALGSFEIGFGQVMLDAMLTVDPDPIVGGATFGADLNGVVYMPETLLDELQFLTTSPSGLRAAVVSALSATVEVRSGATGDNVSLSMVPVFPTCYLDEAFCEPALNAPDGSNPACYPESPHNTCANFVHGENSDDCDPDGICEALGKMDQCGANGFCVTGPLAVPLQGGNGVYTADSAGTVLFGWADESTGAAIEADGTYILPEATTDSGVGVNGGIFAPIPGQFDSDVVVAMNCTMAVESDGPLGVGVPDKASPTPSTALIAFPIYNGGASCSIDADCNPPSPTDCREPAVCTDGICIPPAALRSTGPCAENGVCDPAGMCQYACQETGCDSSEWECYDPSACVDNACAFRETSAAGASCSIGECDGSGNCLYVCQDAECQTPIQCLYASVCGSNNACLPRLPWPEGTDCSSGKCDASGVCRELCGGVLCSFQPTECVDFPQCVDDTCQAPEPSPFGTACDGGTCDGTGLCRSDLCSFGPQSCGVPPDCHLWECVVDSSLGYPSGVGVCEAQLLAEGAFCDGGAGRCDAAGDCQPVCSTADDCTDPPLADCREPQCDGFCQTPTFSLAGTPCSIGSCDASGQCQPLPTCSTDDQCNDPFLPDCLLPSVCFGGFCQLPTRGAEGAVCGILPESVCDGVGFCLEEDTPPPPETYCDTDDECGTGECFEACIGHVCEAPRVSRAGTRCADGAGVCDGLGTCVACVDDTGCPSIECYAGACVDNTCQAEDPLAVGTECGSGVCDGAGSCGECNGVEDCDSSPEDCHEDPQCSDNVCVSDLLPSGTECEYGLGACDQNGTCFPSNPEPQQKNITLACYNNLTLEVDVVDVSVSVTPTTAILSNQPFSAFIDGIVFFPEERLDFLYEGWGVVSSQVDELVVTVVPRAGAFGAPVELQIAPLPPTCSNNPNQGCDPEWNDDAGNPACDEYMQCAEWLHVPLSDDCAPEGVCDGLGKLDQCTSRGSCVTGPAPMPLEAVLPGLASFTAHDSGAVVFGLADESTDATLMDDATYDFQFQPNQDPSPNYAIAGFGNVHCTMAVRGDGEFGVGVPDAVSWTPNEALISFPIKQMDPNNYDCATDDDCNAVDECREPSRCLGHVCQPPAVSPLLGETGCVQDGGGDGQCNLDGVCHECVNNDACDSTAIDCLQPSLCWDNVCRPRNLSPDGTTCSGGGTCEAGVCQPPCVPGCDTSYVDCWDAAECVTKVTTEGTTRECAARNPSPIGTPCSSGTCDGNGGCYPVCLNDLDCFDLNGGIPPNECRRWACVGDGVFGFPSGVGTCEAIPKTGGTISCNDGAGRCDAAGDCQDNYVVDGSEATSLYASGLTDAGNVEITNNNPLTSVDLGSLVQAISIFIEDNPSLIDVNLASLGNVDTLEVINNGELLTLDVSSLTTADEIVLAALGSFGVADLSALTEVLGNIVISENASLTDIDLSSLESAAGLELLKNDMLTEVQLNALQELGSLLVGDNDSLSEILIPNLITIGEVVIRDNGSLAIIDLGSATVTGDALIQQVGAGFADYCSITVGGDLQLTLEETFDLCANVAGGDTEVAMTSAWSTLTMSLQSGTATADTSFAIHELTFAELLPEVGFDPALDPIGITPVVAHQFVFDSPSFVGDALMGYTVRVSELSLEEQEVFLLALAAGKVTVAVKSDGPESRYSSLRVCGYGETAELNDCVQISAFGDLDNPLSLPDAAALAARVEFAWTTDGFSTWAVVLLSPPDTDEDGFNNDEDNCPDTANPDQLDNDGDGPGNACDPDDDNDGVLDGDDAFPLDPGETTDTDGDGTGNNVDSDDDNDDVLDGDDAFPLDPGETTDTDGDGTGNNADPDDDNDGTLDVDDAFPLDPTEDTDTDGDGTGNNADSDDDNDGILDGDDPFPLVPNVAPVASINLVTQDVQYSDAITDVIVSVTDADSPGATISLMNSSLPADVSITGGCTDDTTIPSSCSWTLSGFIDGIAGDYPVTFTADDGTLDSEPVETLVSVKHEDATVMTDPNNVVAVTVIEDGGNSVTFDLSVFVTESQPDTVLAGAASAGDISNAVVTMQLVPVGPGGPIDPTGCSTADNGMSGYDEELTVTCTFDDAPVNTYSLVATVGGDYYTGSVEDAVTVYDPSLGFATGGGWFYWPGTLDKTNFGFTMKYGKNGRNVRGSLLMIRHLADGTKYRVKSNALEGLAIGDEVAFGWASFSGKATYLQPGWDDPVGNYEFTTYVEDHNEPGIGVDRFWIEVGDKDHDVVVESSIPPDAKDNAIAINGGNIAVPHGNGGGGNGRKN